jgi:hypothetical protein
MPLKIRQPKITKIKKNYKQIIYIILGLFLLYGIIWITIRKPQIPVELQATIDSLTNVNKQLIEHQKQIDSAIHIYEAKVKQVDYQIDNIKEKTTIIKEYYHEQSQQINTYTPTELDLFFKARYNY